VEQTDFIKEHWPKARVLVWAHAGSKMRGVDMTDPANWLEEGQPARFGPDENTDAVFPAKSGVASKSVFRARHVTVESGASITVADANVDGNLWVKSGGKFARSKGQFGRYDKNTFCRSDNEGFHFIPNMLVNNKRKDCSTEWLGKWKTGDEVSLYSGVFSVGPDSMFLPTDRRAIRVFADATLVLMSGATLQERGNCYHANDIEINGTLLAGTPARPLTRDCTIGLSFKAKGKGNVKASNADDHGLVLSAEGAIEVHSADPKTARLVFRWPRLPNETNASQNEEAPDLAAAPHGIDMVLAGRFQFDGVEFNDVLKGGILLPNPSVRQAWKNITLGTGNGGSENELLAKFTGTVDLQMQGVRGGIVQPKTEE